jgi:hypothetical protein
MEVFEVEGARERRLVIGYKMGGTSRFFSSLASLSLLPAILGSEVCRAVLQWDHDHISIPKSDA